MSSIADCTPALSCQHCASVQVPGDMFPPGPSSQMNIIIVYGPNQKCARGRSGLSWYCMYGAGLVPAGLPARTPALRSELRAVTLLVPHAAVSLPWKTLEPPEIP